MFAFLLPLVEGWLGPNLAKYAKPLIWIVLAVLILLALLGGKCAYDKSVISKHDAKQTATTAIADKQADNQAADQRRSDDARLTNETAQLQRSSTNGPTDLDRRLAFQRCLRVQQSARAAKRVAPACS